MRMMDVIVNAGHLIWIVQNQAWIFLIALGAEITLARMNRNAFLLVMSLTQWVQVGLVHQIFTEKIQVIFFDFFFD